MADLLQELNADVTGDFVSEVRCTSPHVGVDRNINVTGSPYQQDPAALLLNQPEFFTAFSLVIVADMPESYVKLRLATSSLHLVDMCCCSYAEPC